MERIRKRRCFADSDLLEPNTLWAAGSAMIRDNSQRVLSSAEDGDVTYRAQPTPNDAMRDVIKPVFLQQHQRHQTADYCRGLPQPYSGFWLSPIARHPSPVPLRPTPQHTLTASATELTPHSADRTSPTTRADSTPFQTTSERMTADKRLSVNEHKTHQRFSVYSMMTSSSDVPHKAVGKPFSTFSVESILAK